MRTNAKNHQNQSNQQEFEVDFIVKVQNIDSDSDLKNIENE